MTNGSAYAKNKTDRPGKLYREVYRGGYRIRFQGVFIKEGKWLPADYEYWEKNGMLGLNSYAELLEKIRGGNVNKILT